MSRNDSIKANSKKLRQYYSIQSFKKQGGNKRLKKLVGILIGLVIVLMGLLVFGYFQYKNLGVTKETLTVEKSVATKEQAEKSVATKEQAEKAGSDESYQFQDIESMPKATSVKEAFERIFGKNRLFDDFKKSDSYSDYERSNFNDPYDGEIKYSLKRIYKILKNDRLNNKFIYNPENPYLFERMRIGITMKSGIDTRMEMIDFLHYLKFSGLTKPHIIKEPLPKDSVKVDFILSVTPEPLPSFNIDMFVYPQIKPGMNMPKFQQKWLISSDVIEQMDFSDKQDILNNITMYGQFE